MQWLCSHRSYIDPFPPACVCAACLVRAPSLDNDGAQGDLNPSGGFVVIPLELHAPSAAQLDQSGASRTGRGAVHAAPAGSTPDPWATDSNPECDEDPCAVPLASTTPAIMIV